MIQKEIQHYVDTKSSPYDNTVLLPDVLQNQEVSFYEKIESPTIIFLPLGIILSILIFYLQLNDYDKELSLRKTELLYDYPEIISKLLLLHGAGLTIKNAFSLILSDAQNMKAEKHFIYQEITYTLNKLNNGESESCAYSEFGQRCGIHVYIKLGSLLEQNLKKGSSDLQEALNHEVQEAFYLHKNNILQAGEKAGTKMLIPMILLLIVVMIIIIVPAFLSMTF